MEKIILAFGLITIFLIVPFLLFRSRFARRNSVKQKIVVNFLNSYDFPRRNRVSDRILFRLINNLSSREIISTKNKIALYFKAFSLNYQDLNESQRLIKEKILSKRKEKILKNILAETVLSFSEETLASLYVSGLEKEYGPDYPIDLYNEKMKLIKNCFKDEKKDKKVFFDSAYRKIEDLMDSADKNISEKLILISEKAELCRIFRT